jgi:CTP synthase (UTP-ammonia lyase)
MKRTVNIGILGEFNPEKISHSKTINAIGHASKRLSIITNITWIPTPSLLTGTGQKSLETFDCIWASPGSPYQSMEGAINGIRIARELYKPFIAN